MPTNNQSTAGVQATTNGKSVGSWVFGGFLLAFYVSYLIWGPSVLPDFKFKMLGILSGLLAGLFGFFISGDITTRLTAEISKSKQFVIQATGGVGLAVAAVLWWGASGVASSTTDATQKLASLLTNGGGGTVEVASPSDKSLRIRPSEQVRDLASALSQSNPRYRDLGVLQKANVSVQSYTAAASTIVGGQKPLANYDALQAKFGNGFGPFHFGMSAEKVNALLPHPFGTVAWADLPKAGEYPGADVRYFWVPLDAFSSGGASGGFYDSLPQFRPCWSGQSYVTFEFQKQELIRLSARWLSDCTQRSQLLEDFASAYSISNFNSGGPIAFQVSLNTITVAGYTGADVSSLDVFVTGTPK